ncbi:MAG TPA: hypothetical protein VM785_01070, partial [Gaiellales bacterium]|nr:hypothetical protein [Gaiellales bacterium]
LAAVLILGWGGMAYALRRPLALEAVPLVEIAAGAASSVAFAFLTWRLSTGVVGDALFHVGRMRKIERVDGLSLTSISSFDDGAPHAGYAFPLLHAAWAGVARVAGVDAGTAFIQLAPLCGLAAILGIYAITQRLTGWRLAGYLAAVVAAWDLCTLINGLIMQINQPPPFAFFVLAPAVVILFLASLRGVLLGAYASAAVIAVIALVHPTYAIPCLALMAGILAGSWRAHLAAARSAGVAIAVSGVATAAIAGWIWWVAIRGGERREIITHSDEFVHDGARALLMYPWAPVFGRGYVLVAIVACILLVRYRRTLPAAGAMLGILGLLLVPGVNTAVMAVVGMGQFHRFWQLLPWPVALAAAACVVARLLGRWSIAAAVALAALLLALRAEPDFWREPASWVVVIAIAATVAALIREPRRDIDRGPWWAASLLIAATLVAPIQHSGGTVLDEARAGPHRPPRADLAVGLTQGVAIWFRKHDVPLPVVMGEEHRLFELVGEAPVYAVGLPEARTRAEPKIDTAGRRQDSQRFFDPATSQQERLDLLSRWDVTHVLVDLEDQSDVAGAIMALPGLAEVYRDDRFVILRAAPCIAERSCPVSATGATTT